MIGSIIGGTAIVLGGVAATGATASVWRGLVRGIGRVVEGDPVAALKEVASGVIEPVAITGAQLANLVMDGLNVGVYTGGKIVGLVSPETREMIGKIGSFDNTLVVMAMTAMMPKPPEVGDRVMAAAA